MGRYLLAATALPGHVLPMVRIGQHLVRDGHEAVMLTGPGFADAVRAAGMRFSPLPPDGMTEGEPGVMALDRPPVPWAVRKWRRGRAEMRMLFVTPLAAQYRALAAELAKGTPDAILVDVGFTGVLPLLLGGGERPPVMVCNMCPLMLSSASTAPFGMARQPVQDFDYSAMNWVVRNVLFRGSQAHVDRTLRALGSAPLPVFLSDWPRLADRLLQLSVPSLEYPRADLPDTVIFTGPVLPAAPPEVTLPDWWPDVAAARAVVHVTQGTWDNADLGRLIGPAVRGLARDDVLVVVTTGGRPASALPEQVPGNVRVAEFVPYDLLLPMTDVMVTNGGYGGVQHALSYGVPLVVAGDTADKPEVAARVAYNRCGIDLRTGTPTAASVAAAVNAVLSDGEYRGQAARLRRDIAATRALETIAGLLAGFGAAAPPRRERTRLPPTASGIAPPAAGAAHWPTAVAGGAIRHKC